MMGTDRWGDSVARRTTTAQVALLGNGCQCGNTEEVIP